MLDSVLEIEDWFKAIENKIIFINGTWFSSVQSPVYTH